MSNYRFVSDFNQSEPTNDTAITYFYQLATFPDKKTNKYHLRRFSISDNNEFVDVKNYALNKKQYSRFLEVKKRNEYKCYSVMDLNVVNYPVLADILLAKSSILSTAYDYTGFAPFS